MTRAMEDLRAAIRRIDRRGYKAYKSIAGAYSFPGFVLGIEHVQGDPFADPSRFVIRMPLAETGVAPDLTEGKARRRAMADYLARRMARVIARVVKGNRGTGGSGRISVFHGGQEVLEQTAVTIHPEEVEVRFRVGLPAAGRTVVAREAEEMIFGEIPRVAAEAFGKEAVDRTEALLHVSSVEDQSFLRNSLEELGLVAFLAEGSVLPRRSGVDERPLEGCGAVPLAVPEDLAVAVELPNRGLVRGLGIPAGVTLVVGGGFHGKSTLLNALVTGVYDHVPGDGRELVAALESSVLIRAEDGRGVSSVDISPFIGHLPGGRDTTSFSTSNASGSTSQAANIMEALELGAGLLLVDEDTSATNFMIRDERMQALVAKEKEPITPFVDKVRQLYSDLGVSTVLVMGGSGDYFDVADHVIMMDSYRPLHVTKRARAVAAIHSTRRVAEGGSSFGKAAARRPAGSSISARKGRREISIQSRGRHRIVFGESEIDLSAVRQLVSEGQTRAVGWMIQRCARQRADEELTLREGLEKVLGEVAEMGLDVMTPHPLGELALPRIFEVGAAVNRLRTLRVETGPEKRRRGVRKSDTKT